MTENFLSEQISRYRLKTSIDGNNRSNDFYSHNVMFSLMKSILSTADLESFLHFDTEQLIGNRI